MLYYIHRVDWRPLQSALYGVALYQCSNKCAGKSVAGAGSFKRRRRVRIWRHFVAILAIRSVCSGLLVGQYHNLGAKLVHFIHQIIYVFYIAASHVGGFFAVEYQNVGALVEFF